MCSPKDSKGHAVLWLSGEGKAGLYAADGSLRPEVQRLVNSGATVVGADLLYQGDFLADGKPLSRTPRVKNTREAAAYTFGYNPAVFVHRVRDTLTLVAFARSQLGASGRITVAGFDGAGPWVAAARAQCGPAIDQAVIDTAGFRFGRILEIHDPNFLPGGAKYGDLPALVALGAPGRTWVAGETADSLALAQAQYLSLKSAANLSRFDGEASRLRSAAIDWLLSAK